MPLVILRVRVDSTKQPDDQKKAGDFCHNAEQAESQHLTK
jgi:hypothetical protein